MAYLDIISLAEAKSYLRVDTGNTVDDNYITSIINVSLQFIENYTNQMLYERDKTYIAVEGFVRVYDSPITAIVDPVGAEQNEYSLYSTFYLNTLDTNKLVLTVGIADPTEVPASLKEVAYELMNEFYYGSKTGTMADALTPVGKMTLDNYKRFIM